MIKIKAQQTLINFFFFILPTIIIIWRHINISFEQTTSITWIILSGIVVLVVFIIWSKKKNKIMKIKEAKEIEDDQRKVGTIIYFYMRFVLIYAVLFILLYYVQFNFRSLTGTMEMIGGSLFLGALFRINLAQNTGY